jgi:hypothetical protein
MVYQNEMLRASKVSWINLVRHEWPIGQFGRISRAFSLAADSSHQSQTSKEI